MFRDDTSPLLENILIVLTFLPCLQVHFGH
jgi:hypothetical protein